MKELTKEELAYVKKELEQERERMKEVNASKDTKLEIKALVDSAEFCLVRDWDHHAIRDLIDAVRLIADLPKTEDKDLRLYKRETKKIQR